MTDTGRVARVAGPVVMAEGLPQVRLYDVVRVGALHLLGEVIGLRGERAEVYEDTAGVQVGDAVISDGAPLQVELGPGLLGSIYDGLQRPLAALARDGDEAYAHPFLQRGVTTPAIDRQRQWDVTPTVVEGDTVGPGAIVATVAEGALEHRIIVPPGVSGPVSALRRGPMTVDEVLCGVGDHEVRLLQRWPVRRPRPVRSRLDPSVPLVTGQRVIDSFFPLARGGSATIPGGFGTGKTVTEQSLARQAHVDVVVYVACGERGNELTELLEDFPKLVDPRTGGSLMDRTILVANTSNMPVAAREASIHTGSTLAEYYRDQGYDVALLADSTSRWGEALREVSGRLEEMPGEEGYPAYLPSRLAGFYERAGAVEVLGGSGHTGSVSIVGAVSPPGGDFSEPVTQYSLRLAGTFWALDTDLARRRHFPAIHWARSYSLYDVDPWLTEHVGTDVPGLRQWALALLEREGELMRTVQLLGTDVLAPTEHLVLHTGRVLREDFLQQSAFDEADAFCPLPKQAAMLRVIRTHHEAGVRAMGRGAELAAVVGVPGAEALGDMKRWPPDEAGTLAEHLQARLERELEAC